MKPSSAKPSSSRPVTPESWVTRGVPRAMGIVPIERVALCRAIKSIMAEQNIRFVDLAPVTRVDEKRPEGVSDEYVSNLLDERRCDCEIQVRDLAAWARILGPAVLEAALRAYQLAYDVVPLPAAEGAEKSALRATGGALRAAGELAAEVDQALEDGIVTSEEAAKVAKRAEQVARAARGAGAAVAAIAPKRRAG